MLSSVSVMNTFDFTAYLIFTPPAEDRASEKNLSYSKRNESTYLDYIL